MLTPEEIARETIQKILKPDMENFVDKLGDAENCICKVIDFTNSHRKLTIRIKQSTTDSQYDLIFHGVEYFEGALIWISAVFSVAIFEKSVELVETVASRRNSKAEDFGYEHYLFIVGDTQNPIVRILAARLDISKLDS